MYEDFSTNIANERILLYEKHYFENGHEVSVEQYDETQTLLTRSEFTMNEMGKETEAREYMGSEIEPFKIKKNTYDLSGKLISIQYSYEGEEYQAALNAYDHLGRLISSDVMDEDGIDETHVRTYEGSCPEPKTVLQYHDRQLYYEITNSYILKNGEYVLVEEITDNKIQPFDSRIRRFYDRGEIPNGVIEEVYNTNGDFLEEVREVADSKGNVVLRSWHADDVEGSIPFQSIIYQYDERGNCIHEEIVQNGRRVSLNQKVYDKNNRKVKVYIDGNPATILIYTYSD